MITDATSIVSVVIPAKGLTSLQSSATATEMAVRDHFSRRGRTRLPETYLDLNLGEVVLSRTQNGRVSLKVSGSTA